MGRLQADADDRHTKAAQEGNQRLRFTRDFRFPDDLAGRIQHAQAAQLQRHVDPNMVFHDRPPDERTRTARPALCHHSGRDPLGTSSPVQAHYGIYRTPKIGAFGTPTALSAMFVFHSALCRRRGKA